MLLRANKQEWGVIGNLRYELVFYCVVDLDVSNLYRACKFDFLKTAFAKSQIIILKQVEGGREKNNKKKPFCAQVYRSEFGRIQKRHILNRAEITAE